MRETPEAVSTTMNTRRYCMKATRRASAPYSSDMAVMAAAPPGEEPQAAVLPGRAPYLVSTQPTTAPAAMVVATTASMTIQSWAMDRRMEALIAWATWQPMTAWAQVKAQGGDAYGGPAQPEGHAAEHGAQEQGGRELGPGQGPGQRQRDRYEGRPLQDEFRGGALSLFQRDLRPDAVREGRAGVEVEPGGNIPGSIRGWQAPFGGFAKKTGAIRAALF